MSSGFVFEISPGDVAMEVGANQRELGSFDTWSVASWAVVATTPTGAAIVVAVTASVVLMSLEIRLL